MLKASIQTASGRTNASEPKRSCPASSSGRMFFDHDGRGGDGAVLFATLDARLKLTHKDFEMIA